MRALPRAAGNIGGRIDAIEANRCVNCPRQMTFHQISMWPMAYGDEYQRSGLCDTCQDGVFGERPMACTCDDPCCVVDVGVGFVTCASQHCRIHGADAEPGVPGRRAYSEGGTR